MADFAVYRNAARGGPTSHVLEQHAQKIGDDGRAVFGICKRTDRQTDRQTLSLRQFTMKSDETR